MKDFLFDKLAQEKHIVSIVGAGGKTTIMYQLARYFARQGKKVLVTTTTHIWKPASNFAQSGAEVVALWKEGQYAVVGSIEEATGKLTQLSRELLLQYCSLADLVLVEADGAKGLPCKAPASHEPVLLPESNIVLGVIGLDALHKPVEEVCFRLQEVQSLLKVNAEHILNEEDVAKLLLAELGTRKLVGEREYFIVLNKADDLQRLEYSKRICSLLARQGFDEARAWIRGEALNGGKDCFL